MESTFFDYKWCLDVGFRSKRCAVQFAKDHIEVGQRCEECVERLKDDIDLMKKNMAKFLKSYVNEIELANEKDIHILEKNRFIREEAMKKTKLLRKEVGQVSVQLSRMHVREIVSKSTIIADDTIDTLTKAAIKDNMSLQLASRMVGVNEDVLENDDMVVKEAVRPGSKHVYVNHSLKMKNMIELNEVYEKAKVDQVVWKISIKFLCENCPPECVDKANKILMLLNDDV
jgi:hypothetical protein